jgi:hypothetical protein
LSFQDFVRAQKKTGESTRGWRTDSAKGEDDISGSSEGILLHWLLAEGNYVRYRGHKNGGTSKAKFHKELAETMNAKKVKVLRTAEQVCNKIHMLEQKFKAAHKWTQETGQGVTDNDKFEKYVRGICHVYYELLPIMQDRAMSQALATNEDDDLSDPDCVEKLLEASGAETVEELLEAAGKVERAKEASSPEEFALSGSEKNDNDLDENVDDDLSTDNSDSSYATPNETTNKRKKTVASKNTAATSSSTAATSSEASLIKPRKPSIAGATESSVKSAKKKAKEKEDMFDRNIFFQNTLDSRKAQVQEQVRHNLVLETQVLAETKLKETEDKIKRIELAEKEDDIRMKRIEKVMELKNRGMTAASIKILFPDFKEIVDVVFQNNA